MSRTILEIESLYKTYGEKEECSRGTQRNLVSSISGRIPRNYGKQRFGKNDAVKLYCFGFRPTRGRILLKGQDIGMYTDAQLAAYRGRQIGYLFQQFELLDNLTGGENILLPAQIHKMPEKESRKRMQKLAEYFEIEEVLEKFPNQMSGGRSRG